MMAYDLYTTTMNTSLDPPSYAEAVFQSALPSLPSFSTILQISVSDPRREPDQSIVSGGTSYFSYLITTSTNLPQFHATEFHVRKRFRDVVALSDRLAERYRGFFIPLRPDKNVVGMHKNEFLEQRRAALEKYLRRLVAHPVLRNSEELRAFLEASDRMQFVRTKTDAASRMLDEADMSEVARPA